MVFGRGRKIKTFKLAAYELTTIHYPLRVPLEHKNAVLAGIRWHDIEDQQWGMFHLLTHTAVLRKNTKSEFNRQNGGPIKIGV